MLLSGARPHQILGVLSCDSLDELGVLLLELEQILAEVLLLFEMDQSAFLPRQGRQATLAHDLNFLLVGIQPLLQQ